jgi:conjugal transfer pilus assembly protein TraD
VHGVEHALKDLAIMAACTLGVGVAVADVLRRRGLTWTWATPGLLLALAIASINSVAGILVGISSLTACVLGASWHRSDRHYGADFAEAADNRLGLLAALHRHRHRRSAKRGGWVKDGWLTVGRDRRGLPVSIPVGYESGCHTLVVGATGSGKTVSETWIACRLIEQGHAAIVIDPKGDRLLRDQLQLAADRAGRRFLEWTPEGPTAYNPYGRGGDTEIADKALAGETFTEPHYQRQAQRYLGHAVRAMRAAHLSINPGSLMVQLDPRELEVTARTLPERDGAAVEAYLDGLSDRQRRDLAGVRDRLSILAESDTNRWLTPADGPRFIDLHATVHERAVVYFRLDADRRVLLSQMLAAAIVSDLVTLVADLQADPVATVVVVDEFAATAAGQVARLFGRARSAGISLILGTQELADLKGVREGLREQTLGNVTSMIAHRQNVPESAELIAAMAGTKPVWVTTDQTDEGLLGHARSGRGTRRRGYQYAIHPSRIKQLPTGHAAVVTPGGAALPRTTRMRHPDEAVNPRAVASVGDPVWLD